MELVTLQFERKLLFDRPVVLFSALGRGGERTLYFQSWRSLGVQPLFLPLHISEEAET